MIYRLLSSLVVALSVPAIALAQAAPPPPPPPTPGKPAAPASTNLPTDPNGAPRPTTTPKLEQPKQTNNAPSDPALSNRSSPSSTVTVTPAAQAGSKSALPWVPLAAAAGGLALVAVLATVILRRFGG